MHRKNIKRQTIVNKSFFNSKKLYLLGFTLLLVVVGYTIKSITVGSKLTMLEQEEESLIMENKELTSQLINNSSLTKIEENSSQAGFNKPQKIVYINENVDAVANLR